MTCWPISYYLCPSHFINIDHIFFFFWYLALACSQRVRFLHMSFYFADPVSFCTIAGVQRYWSNIGSRSVLMIRNLWSTFNSHFTASSQTNLNKSTPPTIYIQIFYDPGASFVHLIFLSSRRRRRAAILFDSDSSWDLPVSSRVYLNIIVRLSVWSYSCLVKYIKNQSSYTCQHFPTDDGDCKRIYCS